MIREFDPEVVASSFIKQFYEKLTKNPSELHRFYKEESFFTHCDGPESSQACSGADNIRKRIAELNLTGSKVDLSEGSLDAHSSENNGVIVVTTGLFTPSNSTTPVPFVQTFFLAYQAQNMSAASYFLKNSVFRLISPSLRKYYGDNSVPENHGNSQLVATPKTEVVEESVTSHEHQPEVVPEPAPVEESVHVEHPPAEALVEEEEIEAVSDPVELDVDEPTEIGDSSKEKPRTWLDAVKKRSEEAAVSGASTAQNGVTKASPARANTKSADKSPSSRQALPLPPNVVASSSTAPPKGPGQPSRTDEHRLKHSIFIRHVSEDTTVADMRAYFSVYGNIVHLDVVQSKGFAFIEFDNLDSVKTALTLPGPVIVRGATLSIQERNIGGQGRGDGHKFNKKKPFPEVGAKDPKPQSEPKPQAEKSHGSKNSNGAAKAEKNKSK